MKNNHIIVRFGLGLASHPADFATVQRYACYDTPKPISIGPVTYMVWLELVSISL